MTIDEKIKDFKENSNEDETEKIKEGIKNELIEISFVDLAIFEAYKNMPKEFQKCLSFGSFYAFHRKRMEDEYCKSSLEERVSSLEDRVSSLEDGISSGDDTISDEEETKKIPKEERCIECGIEKKYSLGYCEKCLMILKEQVQKIENEIKYALLEDSKFLGLKSKDAAIAYVKHKYRDKREKNPLIPLKEIASEAYELEKMYNTSSSTNQRKLN